MKAKTKKAEKGVNMNIRSRTMAQGELAQFDAYARELDRSRCGMVAALMKAFVAKFPASAEWVNR